MPELVKIDLFFVKIASQIKKYVRSEPTAAILEITVFRKFPQKIREGHTSSFLRLPSKVHKTTEKLSFHQNDHRIQKKLPN